MHEGLRNRKDGTKVDKDREIQGKRITQDDKKEEEE